MALVGGDVVELGAETVTANGVSLLRRSVEAQDSAGRSLPRIGYGTSVVADNQVWFFGSPDARSWDSRYFGPVPAASVHRVVRPVLTIE